MIRRIPLKGGPEKFTIQIGDKVHRMRVTYADAPRAGWLLDISDADDKPIVSGVPLIPGPDILEAFQHLEFGYSLFVKNTDDDDALPSFAALGTTAFLLAVTADSA